VELALYMKRHGLRPRQVQMFMPTPATLATAAWHSGVDPLTGEAVFVARGNRERSRQRALLFYWNRDEWPHVREALVHFGREDLIGKGDAAIVPPGPAYGAWERRGRGNASLRYDTHMGLKVERASAEEEKEMNWESVTGQGS